MCRFIFLKNEISASQIEYPLTGIFRAGAFRIHKSHVGDTLDCIYLYVGFFIGDIFEIWHDRNVREMREA